MARMIPSGGPRDFEELSKEDWIYRSLSRLPDDFTIVHSLNFLKTESNRLEEDEIDFVVFKPDGGIICIEVKAGQVWYSDGEWRYSSGKRIKGGGPYGLSQEKAHRIETLFHDAGLADLKRKTKILFAVWFPDVYSSEFSHYDMPPDYDKGITLTREDLSDPLRKIEAIFNLKVGKKIQTRLTKEEADLVISKILCPVFNTVISSDYATKEMERKFISLFSDQIKVLDFIEGEPFVAIKGVAGSGKTMIAVEKARRSAENGKRVLFLCHNKLLREKIAKDLSAHAQIAVYTIYSFAVEVRKTYGGRGMQGMADGILEMIENGLFPYDEIIIDEGQDFGQEEIDAAGVISILEAAANLSGGSLYVFYDKNQMVHGSSFPKEIDTADTKLTLRRNCRNTAQIAICCLRAIGEPATEGSAGNGIQGERPRIIFTDGDYTKRINAIDSEIKRLKEKGAKSIVILSCYGNKYHTGIGKANRQQSELDNIQYFVDSNGVVTDVGIYTCRTFKGLEADAVILVRVEKECWISDDSSLVGAPGLLFYTGASRARKYLSIICEMTDGELESVMSTPTFRIGSRQKPKKVFANLLGATKVN